MADQHDGPRSLHEQVLELLRGGKAPGGVAGSLGVTNAAVAEVLRRARRRLAERDGKTRKSRAGHHGFEWLSDRQADVAIHIALGESNAQIALALELQPSYIKGVVSDVLQRTGTSTRGEAALGFILWLAHASADPPEYPRRSAGAEERDWSGDRQGRRLPLPLHAADITTEAGSEDLNRPPERFGGCSRRPCAGGHRPDCPCCIGYRG